jgi:hypothetical protein
MLEDLFKANCKLDPLSDFGFPERVQCSYSLAQVAKGWFTLSPLKCYPDNQLEDALDAMYREETKDVFEEFKQLKDIFHFTFGEHGPCLTVHDGKLQMKGSASLPIAKLLELRRSGMSGFRLMQELYLLLLAGGVGIASGPQALHAGEIEYSARFSMPGKTYTLTVDAATFAYLMRRLFGWCGHGESMNTTITSFLLREAVSVANLTVANQQGVIDTWCRAYSDMKLEKERLQDLLSQANDELAVLRVKFGSKKLATPLTTIKAKRKVTRLPTK